MTWFQLYAAYGAPAFLLVVCFGVVQFERRQRNRRQLHERAPKAAGDPFGTPSPYL